MRNLVLILGDQLSRESKAFDGFDRAADAVWMAEVQEEATHVWSHKLRIALFLSAMRHFRDRLRRDGITVHYHQMTEHGRDERGEGFAAVLRQDAARLGPRRLILVRPGDYRVLWSLEKEAASVGLPLELRQDLHFYGTVDEFLAFAEGKKALLLEGFYRFMRRKHQILLSPDGKPLGGRWNFDRENRSAFGSRRPALDYRPASFPPDETTREVIQLVAARFGGHPGTLDSFDFPVTREQAQTMLRHFIEAALPHFGTYQDAMWTDEPFLYHSRLSSSLNLKLVDPRECVEAAVQAYERKRAPLNSVEGFVRQILGWREYIRGVYWLHMPGYGEMNQFGHDLPVPPFFWNGETDMACIRDTMAQVLRYAYSHHIQRLMVMGLFALLFGVHPRKFHEWHMAMYADAVDWVSLPNALGMSQHGDGGIVGTKPYCASGNYIKRMSNYCRHCRYRPGEATGDHACPFTTLYWEFLDRHFDLLKENARLKFQIANVKAKRNDKSLMGKIRKRADLLRREWTG